MARCWTRQITSCCTSGCSLLMLLFSYRQTRQTAANICNMNLALQDEPNETGPVLQLQDKNANSQVASSFSPPPVSAAVENGNRLSNGLPEEEGNPKSSNNTAAALAGQRHVDVHNSQVIHQLRLSKNESTALHELLEWRRKLCEESEDWKKILRKSEAKPAAPAPPPPPPCKKPALLKKV